MILAMNTRDRCLPVYTAPLDLTGFDPTGRMLPPRTIIRFVTFALVTLCAAVSAADIQRTGGPYVPTPQAVVDAMLELARVGPSDFVVDLGSGDGRIVLTAAQRYKARGLGVDIDPELVKQSNATARERGVQERVSFREQDVLQARIEDATVVTLYLLPGMMQQLQAKFSRELKPGTRIVSHDFPFGEWKPDREVSIDVPEKYGTPGQWKSTLFYWVVPVQVRGTWQVSAPGLLHQTSSLRLDQQYQVLRGELADNGKLVPVASGRLDARRISFKLALPDGVREFSGVVDGDRMSGEVAQGGRSIPWTAVRSDTTPVR